MTKEERIAKIREAQALHKEHPARGVYARTALGQRCDPLDPDADCFCGLGALRRVFRVPTDGDARLAMYGDLDRAVVAAHTTIFSDLIDASDGYNIERLNAAWDALVADVEANG